MSSAVERLPKNMRTKRVNGFSTVSPGKVVTYSVCGDVTFPAKATFWRSIREPEWVSLIFARCGFLQRTSIKCDLLFAARTSFPKALFFAISAIAETQQKAINRDYSCHIVRLVQKINPFGNCHSFWSLTSLMACMRIGGLTERDRGGWDGWKRVGSEL